jgi:hypothetical protein
METAVERTGNLDIREELDVGLKFLECGALSLDKKLSRCKGL